MLERRKKCIEVEGIMLQYWGYCVIVRVLRYSTEGIMLQ
jgi:hypothetical protein